MAAAQTKEHEEDKHTGIRKDRYEKYQARHKRTKIIL